MYKLMDDFIFMGDVCYLLHYMSAKDDLTLSYLHVETREFGDSYTAGNNSCHS